MELLWLFILLQAFPVAHSHLVSNKFPGYGFAWYDPNCGFSCYNAVSSTPLECDASDSSTDGHGGMDMDMDMGMGAEAPTPDCKAQNLPFLETIAYCMSTRCTADVPVWKREEFWATKLITGIVPKWTYSETLEQLGNSTVTMVYNGSSGEVMTMPMVLSDFDYNRQFKFNKLFDHIEMLQVRYIFVLVALGIGIPILCTVSRKLPFTTSLLDRLKPYVVYPSTIGSYHVRPLPWLIGNAPTVGQAAFIFVFFALNIILSSISYGSSQPHAWYYLKRDEMLAYVGYRTGHIGYALLPLVVLFSSRNNFLLWITNWSYGTYLLLHRWIARIFTLQAIIHSVTLLMAYQGSGGYAAEKNKPYWLWGIVATVLACAMLVLSVLWFRRLSYEVFLVLHIILAVFVIVGCWYHVILRWGYNFYDNWLYAAIAVWFFDRAVRVLRVLKNGMLYANVTEISDSYVRIDIPGVRWASKPGYIGYVGFPTLHPISPWENHPFSINSSLLFQNHRQAHAPASSTNSTSDNSHTKEVSVDDKAPANLVSRDVTELLSTASVSFIVKKRTGMTAVLKSSARLLTFLDGPYPHSASADALEADHLLLLGGGIGITGLLGWLSAHPNVKLAWSVKAPDQALVDEVSPALSNVADKQVLVGQRFAIKDLLQREVDAGYKKVGIVVCGPAGMCDEVRAVVAGLGRGSKTVLELHVDAFSW
ncbi:ferric reductase like transmembrane component-domain-containing protein [Boeremia exigua]|uniref:ferric reductase like transmembrane component-domain-containing protein n=1 Tax=Boeremia exigua TaxID=749465 RepID=UPI001E8D5B9A|nr:ferric reductase like transmembrane component-domain-containing protein [Boeremia exigua]KAH6611938.1 ferric reductase like transmembrane component-domain-containing protein [Boeremia exigua]